MTESEVRSAQPIERSVPHQPEIPRFIGGKLPLHAINVLEQPRQTFENIDELAENIAANGLLFPPLVAQFSSQEAESYLETINEMWRQHHTISDLHPVKSEGPDDYFILLAGERRFRALRTLDSTGCFKCREQHGPGSCLARHFQDGLVEVRLMQHSPPTQALRAQVSENIHMRVPPQEEARFYDRFFRALKRNDPDYTISRFAREVGRHPDTIRAALQFCTLPDSITTYVDEKNISYGIAVEIARLKNELLLDEIELQQWALRAAIGEINVADFKQMVTNHIQQQQSGQTLFELFSAEQEAQMKRSHKRRVVSQETIQRLWMGISYLKRTRLLFEEGLLGREDSPYSELSPVRVYRTFLHEMKANLPHFKALLKDHEYADAVSLTEESEALLQELEDTLTGDNVEYTGMLH